MMRVGTEGQITIPERVREYLGIVPDSDIDFVIMDGSVVLVKREPQNPSRGRFAELRGALKGTHTTEQWMRETRGD